MEKAASALVLVLVLMTACRPSSPKPPVQSDTAPAASDSAAADTAAPSDTAEPFPDPVLVTMVGSCLGGIEPGDAGTALLCRGEDWWLPEHIDRSPSGIVTTYGSILDDELKEEAFSQGGSPSQSFSRRLSGVDINFHIGDLTASSPDQQLTPLTNSLYNQSDRDCFDWYSDAGYTFKDSVLTSPCPYGEYWCRYWLASETSLHKDDPFVQAGVHDDIVPSSPVGRYERCPDHDAWSPSRRAIGITSWGTETGNYMDDAVRAGQPSLGDAIEGWLQDNGHLNDDGSLVSGSGSDVQVIYDELHESDRWSETADFFSESVYASIGAAYLSLGEHLLEFDPYAHVDAVQLNGENGLIPYFVDAGLICLESAGPCEGSELVTMSDLIGYHQGMAQAAKISPERWMVNIAQGGADFDGWVDLIEEEGMGLASHGPSVVFNYRFLQHLAHIEYDEDRKAFRATGDHGLSFLHTDLENLDHTDNTWGQYRAFRLSALSALALRFDRLLVSGYTIPSVGVIQAGERCEDFYDGTQLTRCKNYDHSAVAAEGAEDLLAWMGKTIGRSGDEAVEAWCAPLHLGSAGDGELTFADRITQLSDSTRRYGGDPSVYSPLRHYIGSGCDLSADSAYQGTPGIYMDESWTGGEAQVSSGSTMSHKMLTGDAGGDVYPYEGRTTEGTATGSLRMTIAAAPFRDATSGAAVKLVLKPRGDILADDPTVVALRLTTEAASSTVVVSLDSTLGLDDAIYTLTAALPAVDITEPAELTIQHLSGAAHLDILMVRVVALL